MVNFRVLIWNLNLKISYEYDFSEKNAVNFGQALFNKSVAMAMPLVTVDWKPFQTRAIGHYVPVRPDIITSWSQSPWMNCSGVSVAGIDSNTEIVTLF